MSAHHVCKACRHEWYNDRPLARTCPKCGHGKRERIPALRRARLAAAIGKQERKAAA